MSVNFGSWRKKSCGCAKKSPSRLRRSLKIQISGYDSQWPARFQVEAERIRFLLGEAALRVEHLGSTSVPGLPAKPVIDIVLLVPDSADETTYAPALESGGYVITVREPEWFEHRMFTNATRDVNLHVFSKGCPEVDRMILFRDWLRNNSDDRSLYAQTKLSLAEQEWETVQQHADAKTAVIKEILDRAEAGLESAH